ncbi:Uncharacterised protein [Mycobacteroides abscessus subsp. massiliense]|uniref:hypothetical protein n=1 Tax=Mycobacteroides abscessus TaxID=36809 RepID=UPI0009CA6168|nr:hypothetical protein [Mycobacteroides abscessus]SKU56692.1 Uncharacterised protein [Mycobacteroides abscessus subsp. massiliense]
MDRVLALAQGPDRSVSAIARAWTRTQGRQLVIEDVELPVGVFGRWLAIPGRDVVQVGVGVVGRERTIAHELGHMVLGHRGQPVTEYAAELVQIAPAELIAHMLQRTCAETDRSEDLSAWPADECAAERFAGLLTRRLEAGRWGTQGWAHHLDDALG